MVQAPWMVIFPGVAIRAAVLGFNVVAGASASLMPSVGALNVREYVSRPTFGHRLAAAPF